MHANTGNQYAAFWDRESTIQAQNSLDVWASYRWSRRLKTAPPTMDAIFERPAPTLKPWLDERTGLMTHEELHVANTSKRSLGEVELLALSIQYALEATGNGPFLTNLLLHRYPRSGPYERPSKDTKGRLGQAITRSGDSIERAVIEELVRTGARTKKTKYAAA